MHEAREAYSIDRAAALSGVPRSTVYYWAKHEIWQPSVSAERTRLWSLADVLTLRAIYWLRSKEKRSPSLDHPIPATKMREVRRTLQEIFEAAIDLSEASLFVDLDGRVLLKHRESLAHPDGQTVAPSLVRDVLRPFTFEQGIVGPDLVQPRPTLRIISGKLSGEPHVHDTRIRSLDLEGLIQRGYTTSQIVEFYPFLEHRAIDDAHTLEQQLRRNLGKAA